MAHRVLSHTADIGIEVTAPSLDALFDELLSATFQLTSPTDADADPAAVTTRSVEVSAETLEDLVVDTLSEFLFIAETEDRHFCGFRSQVDGDRLVAASRRRPAPAAIRPPEPPSRRSPTLSWWWSGGETSGSRGCTSTCEVDMSDLKRVDDVTWEIPPTGGMRVPGRIFASDALMEVAAMGEATSKWPTSPICLASSSVVRHTRHPLGLRVPDRRRGSDRHRRRRGGLARRGRLRHLLRGPALASDLTVDDFRRHRDAIMAQPRRPHPRGPGAEPSPESLVPKVLSGGAAAAVEAGYGWERGPGAVRGAALSGRRPGGDQREGDGARPWPAGQPRRRQPLPRCSTSTESSIPRRPRCSDCAARSPS